MLKKFFYIASVGVVLLVGSYFVIHFNQESEELTNEVRAEAPGEFVQLQHGMVHYNLQGPDTAQLIVFIHGGGITGMEVWKRNIPYFLNKGYRVLTFDLYGRGYSDRPSIENTPELFMGQLTQLLSRLELDQSFDLVTTSMGAIIGIDYFNRNPDKVKKLVMIDPAASGDYKPNPLLKVPVLSDALLTFYWYPRAIENQRKEFANAQLFDLYSKRLAYFMDFRGYKKVNYSTWMNMLNKSRLEEVKNIPATRMLLIYGSKDPYFKDGKNQYLSRIPTLQTVKIDWAGHLPHYEKPFEVNQVIYSFLDNPSE